MNDNDNLTVRTLADLATTGDANDLIRAMRVLAGCITGPINDEPALLNDVHHMLANLNTVLSRLHRHNEVDRAWLDMLRHNVTGSADLALSLANLKREGLKR